MFINVTRFPTVLPPFGNDLGTDEKRVISVISVRVGAAAPQDSPRSRRRGVVQTGRPSFPHLRRQHLYLPVGVVLQLSRLVSRLLRIGQVRFAVRLRFEVEHAAVPVGRRAGRPRGHGSRELLQFPGLQEAGRVPLTRLALVYDGFVGVLERHDVGVQCCGHLSFLP